MNETHVKLSDDGSDKHMGDEKKNDDGEDDKDGEKDNDGELNVEGNPKTSNVQTELDNTDKATTRNEDVPIVNKRQAVENGGLTNQLVCYFSKYSKINILLFNNIKIYKNPLVKFIDFFQQNL